MHVHVLNVQHFVQECILNRQLLITSMMTQKMTWAESSKIRPLEEEQRTCFTSLKYLPIIISSDTLLVVLRLFKLNHLNDIAKNLVTIYMSICEQSFSFSLLSIL